MADRCRCGLPLDPPNGRHWWPARDTEPDATVRSVVMVGQQPDHLRAERVDDGWHTRGLLANHAEHTPPRPWSELGRCWAGTKHAVVEAADSAITAAPSARRASSLPRHE